jgi:hypothetical protein
MRSKIVLLGLFFALFQLCSVPNLESPECSEARQKVKEFYSYHFADDMSFSEEKLESKKKYLTDRFFNELRHEQTQADVFTTADMDFPKSFSVGKCRLIEPEKAEIDVLLLWKRENYESQQRLIKVELQKQKDVWLIDEIKR